MIHDFPALKGQGRVLDDTPQGDGHGRTYAVTLYGTAYVLDDGHDSERLRALHLERQPESAVFISGEGIAVVTVLIHTARLCDSADKVTNWSAAEGPS